MPMNNLSSLATPAIDMEQLARRCRAVALQRFTKTSCIETSELLHDVLTRLGAKPTRMVCQVAAYSPELARRMKVGKVDPGIIGQPGLWSVGVGLPEGPDDYVGRFDTANNRFVGHVACLVENHLVDASVDQMSRPERDMPIKAPVLCRLTDEMVTNGVAIAETSHGVLIKYVMHPDVAAPSAKRGRIIERMAQGLLQEFSRA
jgi:hypothetical protein